ncbi:hypothetical protein [Mangrovibacterium lignilyticum]|uniref:hypothetical protein n=1 Tax=Mangrovibacterium lignilyticum TaxID=2668052 RepID=UPI0013CF9920|nr:hypothetical protein [Mangrovibacterium lignilyticum]
MKKVQINPLRQLMILIVIFLFFNLLNAGSILYYKTDWNELYSEIDFVLVLTTGGYLGYVVISLILNSFLKEDIME